MKKADSQLTFKEHLDIKFGKTGTKSRFKVEKVFDDINPGLIIQEARKFKKMTQEELAEKAGTTKSYISRIENNGSDIRLSTLKKIINTGLGGKLKLNIEL